MLRREYPQSGENLVYYTFSIFDPYPHLSCVVSTRSGGVSTDYLRSLNLSFRTGDKEEHVIENRTRFYRIADVDAESVAQGQLVHGNHVESITLDSPAGSRYKFPETDGLVTSLKNRPLFIPVADCTAIAFFDPEQQVIGMVHAGWKGAVNGIPQRMVETMQKAYGCNPTNILVGIRPGIGPCCYQVREDLVEIFTRAFPEVASRFFVTQPDDTIHLDMWTALRWQLEVSGILPEHLNIAEICTACHTDEFYSHRAEHGKTGPFACLLILKKENPLESSSPSFR